MPDSGAYITVKGTNGVVKTVTLYTSTADVTEVYKEFIYKGNVVYACTTTDPNYEYATEYRYLDTDGTVRYLCEGYPVQPKSGNVIIKGDLTTDLVVDGNLEVYGEISSNATASGTISYGSLTGTIKQGAIFTNCDISVEDGTLTFDESVSKNDDVFYTTGTVTNASGTTTHFYFNLTVETSSKYALYNNSNGIFIINNGSKINLISNNSSSYALYTYKNGSFTIDEGGLLDVTGAFDGVYSYYTSEFVVGGTLIVTSKFDTGNSCGYGMYINRATLTIKSSGIVDINGGYYGLYLNSCNVVVENGGVVKSSGCKTRGIYQSSGSFTINNGGFVGAADGIGISRGAFTIKSGGLAEISGGGELRVNYGEVIIDGTLTIDGSNQYGIDTMNDCTVTVGGNFSILNANTYGITHGYRSTFVIESGGYGEVSSNGRGLDIHAPFEVGGTLTVTSFAGYAVYTTSNNLTVSGTLYTIASTSSKCITGTVTTTGSGKIYKNGVLS